MTVDQKTLVPPPWQDMEIDYDEMVAKYNEEREKRRHKQGIQQYQHIADNARLASMAGDPFVQPGFTREPVLGEYDAVIVGGGVGGISMAARLVKAGFDNLLIIEKGGDFGGVWYWNRYPGIQIDIESYIYMPLLEDVGYMPKRKYAFGDELHAYFQKLGKHFGLYEKTLFQTEVVDMRWEEDQTRWIIKTARNDNIKAKWLIPATGPFDNPKFPGIHGIETFKGHQFHSARWDYEYTGGDRAGNLEKLRDKKVGMIGTGATGIQVVPHLGAAAKEFYVFQRTPSSIDLRANRKTDPEWFASLKPGWQKERMDSFASICSGKRVEDLVNDGWTESLQAITGWFGQSKTGHERITEGAEEIAKAFQVNDFKKMESIRRRVDQIVEDPGTANSLKPYFNIFCRRPCFHDEYLSTYNRPSVHLVDTMGKGVERITEKGIIANGKEYELDCIVYATGFEYNSSWETRHGTDIVGVNGASLSKRWADGPMTFHGWAVHDFPNCFFVSSAQTSGIPNYQHSLEDQGSSLVHIMQKVKENDIERLEVSALAQEKWMNQVLMVSKDRTEFLSGCTPGYYNDDGMVTAKTIRNNPYAGGVAEFLNIVAHWRSNNKLAGMDLRIRLE